jgi:hypothetical protein
MAITVTHSKVSTIPDGDDPSVIRPSDWNDDHTLVGLGTMAEQDANNVAITGGTISGVAVTGYVPTTRTITAGTGLTGGGDLSANRTLAIANTAVVAGNYGTDSRSMTLAINAQGQITSAIDQPIAIANTQVSGLGTASTKDAGVALGVATLDAAGKVPASQIPLQGDLNYQGTWNATTNTPTLTSSVGTKGYYYVVDVAGTTNLNGITDWQIGDWAIFNGSVWQKVDNTDAVTSVNGLVGTVVLTTTNIAEGTNEYFTTARARASISAGTGISYDNSTGVVTNSAPDQTVALTGAGTTTVTGTYPNFTITSDDQYDGTVTSVGGTGTVNGLTLTGTVTSSGNLTLGGTLDLSSPPAIGGTVPNAVTGTTIIASTGFVSENYLGLPGLGGNLKTNGGTSLLNWDGGGSGNVTVNGGLNANPSNKNVSIAPTGTGTATINPATAGTMNNMVIGGTTPLAGSFTNLSVTGTTKFDGSEGTAGQVLTSAGTGATPTWTTPTTGTVTSVTGTAPIASTGGATPAISISQSSTSTDGYLSSTDWNTFNNKSNTNGTVTSVAALTIGTTGTDLSSTVANGTTTPVITLQVPTASATNRGALSSTDWSTFNGKAPAVTYTTNYVPFGQGTTTPNLSASFTYVTGTGTLTAPAVSASNGLVVNSNTVSASYSIPSGSSASSVGPMTVASGQTVTIASGSRWVVL